jgi:flagellar biosynthesis chaperone FliJ
MTPAQIKQALNVRMLRADKAERALTLARATESQALGALNAGQAQLDAFDASYEARIAAFFEKTSQGVTPESLHSARTFHADLGIERGGIENIIAQAEQVVALAQENVAQMRSVWAAASRAADNLGELYAKAVSDAARNEERLAEGEADEMSLFRAYRDAG